MNFKEVEGKGQEAKITIGGIDLNNAQSMAVRVSISNMLMDLQDPEMREGLGDIGGLYENRLREVEALIINNINKLEEMTTEDN